MVRVSSDGTPSSGAKAAPNGASASVNNVAMGLDSTRLSQMDPSLQIDYICDAFLSQWQNGNKRPLIADYIPLVSPNMRQDLLRELVLTEQQLKKKHGDSTPSLKPADSTRMGLFETSRTRTLMPSRVGEYVPRYELGRGAAGVVYAATEVNTGHFVAIKVPHPYLLSSSSESQRILREARNIEGLKHPGIVEFLYAGSLDDNPYLVYEFLHGVDLSSYLKLGLELTLHQRLNLIVDVAEALQYAHDNNVVHRDLKPSNLMIVIPEEKLGEESVDDLPDGSQKLKIKLLDFGIARLLNSGTIHTQAGEIIGTPHYMSPEQASGQSHVLDHRADIYSLGVILYELLTGSPPFTGNATEVTDKIRNQEVPLLSKTHPHIPHSVATICNRCLRRNPAMRYSRVEDIATDIKRFINGQSIQAKPVHLFEQLSSYWHQHKLSRIAATAGIATLCTALISIFAATVVLNRQNQGGLISSSRSAIRKWLDGSPESAHYMSIVVEKLKEANIDDLIELSNISPSHQKQLLFFLEQSADNDIAPELMCTIACMHDSEQWSKWVQSGRVSPNSMAAWVVRQLNNTKPISRIDTGEEWQATQGIKWHRLLRPIIPYLESDLVSIYHKEHRAEQRAAQAELLCQIFLQSPSRLLELTNTAFPEEIPILASALARSRMDWQNAISIPWHEFDKPNGWVDRSDEACRAFANQALLRYEMGDEGALAKSLQHCRDPRLFTYFAHQFIDAGHEQPKVLERLLSLDDRTQPDILFGWMTIAWKVSRVQVSAALENDFRNWLLSTYEHHPDSGVHGMCRSFLTQWNWSQVTEKNEADERLIELGYVPTKDWFVDKFGNHMAIISAPGEYVVQKDDSNFWRLVPKEVFQTKIDHSYAISMDEFDAEDIKNRFGIDSLPAVADRSIGWYDSLSICHWLNQHSDLAGVETLDEQAWLADSLREDGNPEVIANFRGYRIPTLFEWDCAARMGIETPRIHGTLTTPFSNLYSENSETKLLPPLPNRKGLMLVQSRMAEWTLTRAFTNGIPSENMFYFADTFTREPRSFLKVGRGVANRAPIATSVGLRFILSIPDFH